MTRIVDIRERNIFSSNLQIHKLHIKSYLMTKNSFLAEVTFKLPRKFLGFSCKGKNVKCNKQKHCCWNYLVSTVLNQIYPLIYDNSFPRGFLSLSIFIHSSLYIYCPPSFKKLIHTLWFKNYLFRGKWEYIYIIVLNFCTLWFI